MTCPQNRQARLLSPSAAAVVAVVGLLAISTSPANALLSFPDCAKGPLANNTVCNPKAKPADRAAALVKAMTLDEKLDNLINTSPGAPRIGLPPYEWWSEALHGVAGSPGVSFSQSYPAGEYAYATSFASPITMSAAFDDDLIARVAEVVSTEARSFSNAGHAGLDFWTPNINPYKDPRWGRGAETPGEDPFRIKGYVEALLRGLEGPRNQNQNQSQKHTAANGTAIRKVIATCKHFAAYDLERWNGTVRYGFDAIVSLQDLSEYYLPPFQQCARDSNVGSIMCSYNAVNGTPACASTYLMTDILRNHWGWTSDNQYITSDCNAIKDFDHEHNFSADGAHAAGTAYTAGTDTVCEVSDSEGTNVRGAFEQKLVSEATIDRALGRLYEGLVRAGYFDPADASPYRALAWKDVNTPAARRLAWQSAADGLVLKKNVGGLLPLKLTADVDAGGGGGRSVALVGHWAGATRQMLGGYSGIPPYYHNPRAAAEARNLTYYYGGDNAPVNPDAGSPDTWTAPALEAAEKADVVLYFGGNDLSVAAEDKDRDDITWPEAQLDLIAALAALGKPLVVVQLGDQNDDTPLLQNANVSALLWAGFPGQDGGTAVFDAITGSYAPAGRLPVTQYPGDYAHAVPMTEMALRPGSGNSGNSGNPGRTYRWYEHAVLPFGYGLHYTNFSAAFARPSSSATVERDSGRRILSANSTYAISDLVSAAGGCTHTHRDLCEFASIPVSVENAGETTTSDFVALVFVSGQYGPTPYPLKTLAAYKRLRGIQPGQTAHAQLPLSIGSLARTDVSGNLVLYPGQYSLLLDVPTQSQLQFTLTGDAVVLDEFPQPQRNST